MIKIQESPLPISPIVNPAQSQPRVKSLESSSSHLQNAFQAQNLLTPLNNLPSDLGSPVAPSSNPKPPQDNFHQNISQSSDALPIENSVPSNLNSKEEFDRAAAIAQLDKILETLEKMEPFEAMDDIRKMKPLPPRRKKNMDVGGIEELEREDGNPERFAAVAKKLAKYPAATNTTNPGESLNSTGSLYDTVDTEF